MGSSDENPVTLGTLVVKANECIHDFIHKKMDNLQPMGKFMLKSIYPNIITHFKVCIFII